MAAQASGIHSTPLASPSPSRRTGSGSSHASRESPPNTSPTATTRAAEAGNTTRPAPALEQRGAQNEGNEQNHSTPSSSQFNPLPNTDSSARTAPDIESSSRAQDEGVEPLKLSIGYYAQLRTRHTPRREVPNVRLKSIPPAAPPQQSPNYVTAFFVDVIFRQLYWHLLLRVPEVYWSRVSRMIQAADIPDAELASLLYEVKVNHPGFASSCYTLPMSNAKWSSESYLQLEHSWENFLDSAMREWKIMNLVSVLLLGAIASLLQIELVAMDPLVRTAAFISMVCALMSLLYGCIYSIRFFDLKKPYKAFPWTEHAKKNQLNPFWNVWVFLGMPAIWLVWSLIAYLVAIMAYVWRVGGDGTAVKASPGCILDLRIVVTLVLCLGLVYLCLIIGTLKQYGVVMEDQWREKAFLLREANPKGFVPKSSGIYRTSQAMSRPNLDTEYPYSNFQNTPQPVATILPSPSDNTILPLPLRDVGHSAVPVSETPLHSAMKKPRSLSPLSNHPRLQALRQSDIASLSIPSRQGSNSSTRVTFSNPNIVISEKRTSSLPPRLSKVAQDDDLPNIPRSKSADVAFEVAPMLLKDGELSPISESPHVTPVSLEAFIHTEPPEPHSQSIPQTIEGRPSCFPTVKVLFLNPTQLVDPLIVADERNITHEDWNTFVQELNHVCPPGPQALVNTHSANSELQLDDRLFELLNSWNDGFFSSRGLKIVYCCEIPKDSSRLPQHSLYLCDISLSSEKEQLGAGEFDSAMFRSVSIMTRSTIDSLLII
ncbi:hypothetical protein BDN72DRAFT_960327 [Pluteus cervinus]|uniref:Uncharacterized protein n=1 Tax=Pluteus cervinus TaxID=181527 RepID=A0ACD3ARJ3_9AGAR|nr:hypothetical protein BDN72DRAFT_960327 [Pluteus cervinus]